MSYGVGSDHPIFLIQAFKVTFWSWTSWVSLVQLTMERMKEKKIMERKGLRKKNSFVRFEVLRGKKKRRRRRRRRAVCGMFWTEVLRGKKKKKEEERAVDCFGLCWYGRE